MNSKVHPPLIGEFVLFFFGFGSLDFEMGERHYGNWAKITSVTVVFYRIRLDWVEPTISNNPVIKTVIGQIWTLLDGKMVEAAGIEPASASSPLTGCYMLSLLLL